MLGHFFLFGFQFYFYLRDTYFYWRRAKGGISNFSGLLLFPSFSSSWYVPGHPTTSYGTFLPPKSYTHLNITTSLFIPEAIFPSTSDFGYVDIPPFGPLEFYVFIFDLDHTYSLKKFALFSLPFSYNHHLRFRNPSTIVLSSLWLRRCFEGWSVLRTVVVS